MKHIYAIAQAVPASTFNDPNYQSELTQEIAQVQHSAEMFDMLKACQTFLINHIVTPANESPNAARDLHWKLTKLIGKIEQ